MSVSVRVVPAAASSIVCGMSAQWRNGRNSHTGTKSREAVTLDQEPQHIFSRKLFQPASHIKSTATHPVFKIKGSAAHLHALDLKLHVVLSCCLAILPFFPSVSILPVLYFLSVVEDDAAILWPETHGHIVTGAQWLYFSV